MMIIRSLVLVSALTLTASCASAQAPPLGTIQKSVQAGGLTRTYIQVVPDACKTATANCPLVFGFHGGGVPGVSGAQFDKQTGLSAVAQERSFIAIMPNARSRNWNDGRPEVREKADDVGFVKAIIAALRTEKVAFDESRVFATGMSNGGFMSYRLACEMSETFTAVAPVVASLGTAMSAQCKPARAISILNIVGSADPLVPFGGGAVRLGKTASRGDTLSSDDTVAFWIKANGCKAPAVSSKFDRDPDDGTSVTIDRYEKCARGTVFERRVVIGGGHLWPGEFPKGVIAMISGRPTREFEATGVILDFFGIKKVAKK
jgi:polyhydroxybutyrate depolymerase